MIVPSSDQLDRATSQRQEFGRTLVQLISEGAPIVVLDGDLANSTKIDIVAETHPDRFLMMGIAEQNMVGVAAGMSTLGLVPWVVSFASFLVNRDLDQVRVVVAQPRLNVKLAGSYSGLLTGKTGKTHQDVWDLAVMRAIPHMTVIAPADAVEAAAAVRAASAFHGPVYVRLARDPAPAVFDESYRFEIGAAVSLRQGRDLLFISTGVQTARTLQAADILLGEGIDAGVMHIPTLKPLDVARILAEVARHPSVVTVEEHSVIGGLGSAVAEVLSEHRPTRMKRIGIQDRFGDSGGNDELLDAYGLSPKQVAGTVREWLADRP
ncbi:MAG: transketolase family protein [Candidatus Limnocylindrales bacterium]